MENSLNTFDYLSSRTKILEKQSKVKFGGDRQLIDGLFRLQTEIGDRYLWTLRDRNDKTKKILFTAYWKNLFSFYAAYELTNKGLFGPAKSLLRNVFEFLLLSKYCTIKNDLGLIQRWEEGDTFISLKKKVISKIKKPSYEGFLKLWEELCKYSHASIYSMQVDLENNDEFIKNVGITYTYIRIMLDWNYHLMNTYLFDGEKRVLVKLYKQKDFSEIKRMKKVTKELIKINFKYLDPKGKSLIKNYKFKWIVE